MVSLIVVESLKRMNLLRISCEIEDDGFDVWLKQSHVPPPAPDVLMQLPEMKKNNHAPWKDRTRWRAEGNGKESSGGAKAPPTVANGLGLHHPPQGPIHRSDYGIPPLIFGNGSMGIFDDYSPQHFSGVARTNSLSPSHAIDETDNVRQKAMTRSQADMDYATYQARMEEKYEKELMQMCGFSQEGDIESTQKTDSSDPSDPELGQISTL
jgi:hypothetical protein